MCGSDTKEGETRRPGSKSVPSVLPPVSPSVSFPVPALHPTAQYSASSLYYCLPSCPALIPQMIPFLLGHLASLPNYPWYPQRPPHYHWSSLLACYSERPKYRLGRLKVSTGATVGFVRGYVRAYSSSRAFKFRH